MVEDEDDGSGEEDGDQADTETEDPVVVDGDVEVEGGEHGAPHHHVQHLLEEKERSDTKSIKYCKWQLKTGIKETIIY